MSLTAPPKLSSASSPHADAALRILNRLMHGFVGGAELRLWNNSSHRLGVGAGVSPPAFTLVLRDPMLLRRLVTNGGPVLWADAYFRGQIDVEGDLYSALALKGHFEQLSLPWRDKMAMLFDAWRLPSRAEVSGADSLLHRLAQRFSRQHTRHSDRQAIAFHYDVSNAFYALWLDMQRVYSCAYFKTPDDTLDQAQENKLEHICLKLRLQLGERLLDIGCGWGALVCWAARHHGVHAHGITYGITHGITHYKEGWNHTVATEFINRSIFPDGEFDCVSNIQLGMERAGFEIQDVEALRRHYALTLRHWVRRLEAHREEALCEVDESTYRVWRLYMAACALEFETGGTGICQILASRRGVETSLPLTRDDLYAPQPRPQ
jgi:cyclopropane fatty-acyl-phospholipid synthase-like methyltransferase